MAPHRGGDAERLEAEAPRMLGQRLAQRNFRVAAEQAGSLEEFRFDRCLGQGAAGTLFGCAGG